MSASIGDVAARAGVSVATVSRALRGLPNVAPSTRNRVLAAAHELDYVADPHASRLAAGKTRTVGMVVPMFTQWFFTQVVSGAEGVLTASGYDILLYSVSGAEAQRRFLASLPFRKRVDGLIVVDLPLSPAEQQALGAGGTPVVLVGGTSAVFPTVRIDNVAAGMAATRHLVNLGHEHVAMISNLPDDPLHFTAPLERRRGYQCVLRQLGLAPRPDFDVPGNFSLAGGAEAMAQLLAAHPAPTAVFAQSDEMAIGALRTVRHSGLRVPEDISIVGFDDHDMAEYLGLTTIGQPVVQLGEAAAELLLRATADDDGTPPTEVVLPTKLRVRSTTGPPRAARGARAARPPTPLRPLPPRGALT